MENKLTILSSMNNKINLTTLSTKEIKAYLVEINKDKIEYTKSLKILSLKEDESDFFYRMINDCKSDIQIIENYLSTL